MMKKYALLENNEVKRIFVCANPKLLPAPARNQTFIETEGKVCLGDIIKVDKEIKISEEKEMRFLQASVPVFTAEAEKKKLNKWQIATLFAISLGGASSVIYFLLSGG